MAEEMKEADSCHEPAKESCLRAGRSPARRWLKEERIASPGSALTAPSPDSLAMRYPIQAKPLGACPELGR